MFRTMSRVFLAAIVVSLTAGVSFAQQTTTGTQTKAFEVLSVEGNTLVVKLPEGTRELVVADDFRFTINGQPMSVHQLKPGMKGTATITTTTTVTPVTVTEVKNGTVVQATGSSIIVRTDEGFKSFTQGDIDKRGIKIMRAGKPAQISDFHNNDRITATIITSKPPQVLTEQQVNATLAPGAAAKPAAGAAAGGAAAAPARTAPANTNAAAAKPAPAAGASAPPARTAAAPATTTADGTGGAARKLPKTATSWPLLGLVSLVSLAIGGALTLRRRLVH